MDKIELQLQNISKQYGSVYALKQINALLGPGVYALLGPNGAGKTTLQNIIADLLIPTEGKVLWCGQEIHKLGASYRAVLGYLPQDPSFYGNFTGIQIMDYFARLRNVVNPHKRISELLELVGLTSAANRKVSGYSGGMLRRLGIAVTLIGDPKLLILDEPTAGLDPKERIRFRSIIGQLGTEKIVLLATHIVSDVEHTAGNILLLNQGKLLAANTADQLKDSLHGKLWLVNGTEDELAALSKTYRMGTIQATQDGCAATVFSDDRPTAKANPKAPDLEDVYLYYIAEENA